MVQVILTSETVTQLERRKEEIERELKRLNEEHHFVCRKLEAIPLFLSEANGSGLSEPTTLATAEKAGKPDEAIEKEMSLPMAVQYVLQKRGRLTALEIREAVLKAGVPRERLGATYSYLYTALGRLEQKGQIQRVRGKYQLPPGVTIEFKPEEADLKR